MAMRPDTIYKYLSSDHAIALTRHGCIRIGTLHNYRDTEEHGQEIGDKDEGITIEYSHDKEPKTGDKLNRFESIAFKLGSGMIVSNIYLERPHRSPNLYLYCASLTYDPSILHRLNLHCPGDEYDACVRITNVGEFVAKINAVFSAKARFVGAYLCTYTPRKFHYTDKAHHPALIKDCRYSYQQEVRLIWEPNNKDDSIEPVCLSIKNLTAYCSLQN